MSLRDCTEVNIFEGSRNLCTNHIEWNDYGFEVNKGSATFFLIAFGISATLHFYQAVRYRTWSMIWTAGFCALCEAIGWIGRIGSAWGQDWFSDRGGYWAATNESWFLVQICCLIIAPAFLAAALYICLGWLIQLLGPQYSPLRPKVYLYLFVIGDVLSLVIQAAGGGLASSSDTQSGADTGANIMLAGIVWQIVVMLAFYAVYFIFLMRMKKGYASLGMPIDKKPKTLLYAIGASMTFVFIRSVYRVAELSQGWNSSIIENQPLFIVLDGVMMVIAVYILNVFHPGRLLPAGRRSIKAPMTEKTTGA